MSQAILEPSAVLTRAPAAAGIAHNGDDRSSVATSRSYRQKCRVDPPSAEVGMVDHRQL